MPSMTDADTTNSQWSGGGYRSAAERMKRVPIRVWLPPFALLVLGACATAYGTTGEDDDGFIDELPEAVVAVAAPNQDLTAVKLLDDGCYWYQYAGKVEVTMLPLRTTDGRPICARAPQPHPPASTVPAPVPTTG